MNDADKARADRIYAGLACLIPIWLMLSGFSSDESQGGKIHQAITRDALAGTLSDGNMAYVIKAVESQGDRSGADATQAGRHFEKNKLAQSLRYMNREKRKALNYAREADVDPDSRAYCLRHLGLMMHTAQDFYSATNYVELQLEDPVVFHNPYDMPLVDWSLVPDGYGGLKSGSPLVSAVTDPFGNTITFAKDNASTKNGKQKVGKTNLFNLARELAVRETQRQWNLFEALIRGRYHNRSQKILAALRQASPSDVQPPGSE